MSELSLAAEKVMDASGLPCGFEHYIAAALCALVDLYDPYEGKVAVIPVDQLLAIAAKLDPSQPEPHD